MQWNLNPKAIYTLILKEVRVVFWKWTQWDAFAFKHGTHATHGTHDEECIWQTTLNNTALFMFGEKRKKERKSVIISVKK